MWNAVCTLLARLKPAEEGIFSFPWKLFIISSSFLVSWCIRRASHKASIVFIKEKILFSTSWQVNILLIKNRSGGECEIIAAQWLFLCLHRPHVSSQLWFPFLGKQMARDSLDLFCRLHYRGHKNLILALKRDHSWVCFYSGPLG